MHHGSAQTDNLGKSGPREKYAPSLDTAQTQYGNNAHSQQESAYEASSSSIRGVRKATCGCRAATLIRRCCVPCRITCTSICHCTLAFIARGGIRSRASHIWAGKWAFAISADQGRRQKAEQLRIGRVNQLVILPPTHISLLSGSLVPASLFPCSRPLYHFPDIMLLNSSWMALLQGYLERCQAGQQTTLHMIQAIDGVVSDKIIPSLTFSKCAMQEPIGIISHCKIVAFGKAWSSSPRVLFFMLHDRLRCLVSTTMRIFPSCAGSMV